MPAFVPDSFMVCEVVPSPNQGERKGDRRPDMIVLHYTGMENADAALKRLCSAGSDVSSHYFVFEDGRVIQSVPESRRAWHAGESSWAGETDINSCSIGIEIANPGHDFGYPDFTQRQIAAVASLCRGIVIRHQIPPERVLAHSDVAPSRKRDPGEKFPWSHLHRMSVGHWVEPHPLGEGPSVAFGETGPVVETVRSLFAQYGYGLPAGDVFDDRMRDVVVAFQRHFRPALIDGVVDTSTLVTLRRLIDSRPSQQEPDIPLVALDEEVLDPHS
jgi:N-acetylmuramoyl-L-alanine amidase